MSFARDAISGGIQVFSNIQLQSGITAEEVRDFAEYFVVQQGSRQAATDKVSEAIYALTQIQNYIQSYRRPLHSPE